MAKYYDELTVLKTMIEQTNANPFDQSMNHHPNQVDWNERVLCNNSMFDQRSSDKNFDLEKYIHYDDLLEILQFNESYMKQFDICRTYNIKQYVLPERVNHPFNTRAIYRYDERQNELILEWELPDSIAKKDLILQEEFSVSGAVIVFVAPLYEIMKRYGPIGYKTALQEVGSIAHYTWLQSLTYGYQGTVFAGFIQKVLRRFTMIDGYYEGQLFAYAFGHEKKRGMNPSSPLFR